MVLYSAGARLTLDIQGYPVEWFPSVSATIGDRYPERSVFMVFIALTSGKCGINKSKDITC